MPSAASKHLEFDYEKEEKPWSRVVCRTRFTNGEEITLEELHEISGVKLATLEDWHRISNWAIAREKYQAIYGEDPDNWKEQDCRDLYVRQEKRVSLRGVAEISGNSYEVVKGWADRGDWSKDREKYQEEFKRERDRLAYEAAAREDGVKLRALSSVHVQGAEYFRKMALEMTAFAVDEFEKARSQDTTKALRLVIAADFRGLLRDMSAVHAQAIAIQRDATGLEYQNLNKAMEAVIRAGYDVVAAAK